MEFVLEKENQEDCIIWKGTSEEYPGKEFGVEFIIKNNNEQDIVVEIGSNIVERKHELVCRFKDLLFEEKMRMAISEGDGFDDADDSETNDGEKYDPYNPKLIRVDTKTFSIRQIFEMLEEGEIDLSPDFQRGFVWTDISRKSRLIESLLLRIPLPVFYFAQDEEGLFQVVDGVQRLTVIKSFLNNEFKLKNLEDLTDCEGKWYKHPNLPKEESLTGMYTRRIEQTQLYINIIDPQTPDKVKFDIFKRINTGGKVLNNQEMRNCLANSRTRELLRSLATSEEFLKATRGSISHVRMADEELILRFVAFYLIDEGLSYISEYKGGMDELLDETVNLLNKADLSLFIALKKEFANAMINAFDIFGNRAFRKSNYINKALFLGLSRVLRKYTPEQISSKNTQGINLDLRNIIADNSEFTHALSMATNDARNVNIVYETISKIVEKN